MDRTRQWGREGGASDQEAARDTRGKLTLFHSLPSGQPGAEKRFEMNVFTHQSPATWLLSARERVPGACGTCGSPVGAGLWAPLGVSASPSPSALGG